MESTRIFFNNLPTGISVGRLKSELRRIFEDVPEMDNLEVEVFTPLGNIQKAVVSGFKCRYRDLERAAAGKRIHFDDNDVTGREVTMHNDTGRGKARDTFGRFVKYEESANVRSDKLLQGITYIKVSRLFSEDFWEKVNKDVYDGIRETVAFNRVNLSWKHLERFASVNKLTPVQNTFSMIKFSTVLDTLQAIRKLNMNNEVFDGGCFFNKKRNIQSEMDDCMGMGRAGAILKVEEMATEGVIPLGVLDEDILNDNMLSQNLKCLRCKAFYAITGVDVNLDFLRATCQCSYSSDVDIEERGFCWPGESFTRLTITSMFADDLEVWHYPMRLTGSYSSSVEYKDTVVPMLFAEWKLTSRPFKQNNRCTGIVSYAERIETVREEERSYDVIGMSILVPKTSFWNVQNRLHLNMLTLTDVFVKKGPRQMLEKRKVKLLFMEDTKDVNERRVLQGLQQIQPEARQEEESGYTTLFMQMALEEGYFPIIGSAVKIFPKLDKTSYEAAKEFLNKWSSKEDKAVLAQKIFLDPNSSYEWIKPLEDIKPKETTERLRWLMKQFHKKLNPEQKHALRTAISNSVAMIHGPPGTGKTFTAAAIIITLWFHEKGIIVATAPSNIACDNLCMAIKTASPLFRPKILRIYAKRREFAFIEGTSQEAQTVAVDSLHELLYRSAQWQEVPALREIHEKIQRGNRHRLTKQETTVFVAAVKEIERDIISNYDVLVCTYSALCDRRVSSWNKNLKITTVLADEAAQATQPGTLPIFTLNAKRYCFVGDHLQLTSTISPLVEKTGLSLSILEWVAKARDQGSCAIPWCTLLEQRRMASNICKLVSKFTYDDQLRDAAIISERSYPYDDIYSALRDTVYETEKNTVVLYDHNEPESKENHSFKNCGEAQHVANVVGHLLSHSIPKEDITVLTLYEAQRKEISKYLNKEVEVKNVDGFQGKENQIVLVSLTRCNKFGAMGFTSKKNRLNVAFSRARFQLLIFASLSTISKNNKKVWKDLTQLLQSVATINEI